MQPLIFMADLTRGTTTRNSAQARNIKLVCLMNTKSYSYILIKLGLSSGKLVNPISSV